MSEMATVRVSRQMFEELKAAAEQSGRPVQELLNGATEQFIKENG